VSQLLGQQTVATHQQEREDEERGNEEDATQTQQGVEEGEAAGVTVDLEGNRHERGENCHAEQCRQLPLKLA
jgi:hypothetical protein